MFRRKNRWSVAAIREGEPITFEAFMRFRFFDQAQSKAHYMNKRYGSEDTSYVVWDREKGEIISSD